MDTKSLTEALLKQYPSTKTASKPLSKQETLDVLYKLQAEGVPDQLVSGSILSESIDPFHFAVISFLDAELTSGINATRLPEDVTSKLRGISAAVMRIGIADGLIGMTKSPIIPILEALMALAFGWTDLKGKVLDSTARKLNDALQSLLVATGNLSEVKGMVEARNHLLELLEGDIVRFVSNERDRTRKLEQRLTDAASGKLTAERSKQMAARMLNERMEGHPLPQEIVQFLHGVWFDSIQLIATRQGPDSDEWYRVVQLTETLISTLQPNSRGPESAPIESATKDVTPDPGLNLKIGLATEDLPEAGEAQDIEADLLDAEVTKAPENVASSKSNSNQQLYRILENLPGELKTCLVSIEHDEDAVTTALDSIEAIHIRILKADPLENIEFDLLPTGPEALSENTRISKSLLAPVLKLNAGSWFVLQEESGSARHIKLTLKADDSQHFIFTNRSGSSALQTSFEEFAYLLSSGTVAPLPIPGELLKNVRRSLMSSLKAKAKDDEVALLRQQRQAEETRAQVMDDTQFILLAVPKPTLADESVKDIVLDRASVLQAMEVDDEGNSLIFVDQSGHKLNRPDTDQVVKLITGQSIEVEDEMPVGMTNFRSSVERMRKHTQLVQVETDD